MTNFFLIIFLTIPFIKWQSNSFNDRTTIKNETKEQEPLNDSITGEKKLFITNCMSCHRTNNNEMVGPGLASATSKYSSEWLYKWTTNATLLISSGDKKALALFYKYEKIVHPSFDLTKDEVTAIYKYIDSVNLKQKSNR